MTLPNETRWRVGPRLLPAHIIRVEHPVTVYELAIAVHDLYVQDEIAVDDCTRTQAETRMRLLYKLGLIDNQDLIISSEITAKAIELFPELDPDLHSGDIADLDDGQQESDAERDERLNKEVAEADRNDAQLNSEQLDWLFDGQVQPHGGLVVPEEEADPQP